jgi:hypothetical protein
MLPFATRYTALTRKAWTGVLPRVPSLPSQSRAGMASPPECVARLASRRRTAIMEQIRTKMKDQDPNRSCVLASPSGRYRLHSVHHSAACSAAQVAAARRIRRGRTAYRAPTRSNEHPTASSTPAHAQPVRSPDPPGRAPRREQQVPHAPLAHRLPPQHRPHLVQRGSLLARERRQRDSSLRPASSFSQARTFSPTPERVMQISTKDRASAGAADRQPLQTAQPTARRFHEISALRASRAKVALF